MKLSLVAILTSLGTLLAGAPALFPLARPVAQEVPDEGAMRAMMEQAQRYTKPGEHHAILARFLGSWDTETRFFMGATAMPAEKGTAEITWRMEGRWLQLASSGSLMGMPFESFTLMGYDNFKQSYVATTVSNMDTAMNRSEGDMDPGGKALLLYGTLDEYLTGEHDKMVKTVFRFVSADEIVMEIHDLPIGEANTKVVEVRYARRAS